jgi:diadenosine tetraphosphate (Ap4A) HIT family hydrolase
MRELEDLPDGEAALVLQETLLAGRVIRVMAADRWPVIEKLNMAAIGNVAPQLHLHVVGRWRDDAEWPHPVWGRGLAQPYSKALQTEIVTRARAAFAAVEPIVAAPYPAPPPGGHSEAIL